MTGIIPASIVVAHDGFDLGVTREPLHLADIAIRQVESPGDSVVTQPMRPRAAGIRGISRGNRRLYTWWF